MNIEQLKQEENKLLNLLSENRSRQKELSIKSFIEKHGVDIGDVVEWKDGKNVIKGVVSEIECGQVKANYYKALLFNTDGKVGKRCTRIWYYSMDSLKVISKAKKLNNE